jgi:hypothetical protein
MWSSPTCSTWSLRAKQPRPLRPVLPPRTTITAPNRSSKPPPNSHSTRGMCAVHLCAVTLLALTVPLRSVERWEKECASLLQLYSSAQCKETEPVYVYSRAVIQQRAAQLKALKHVTRVFYAVRLLSLAFQPRLFSMLFVNQQMKANFHPEVLKTITEAGVGIECVSIDEVPCSLLHL